MKNWEVVTDILTLLDLTEDYSTVLVRRLQRLGHQE